MDKKITIKLFLLFVVPFSLLAEEYAIDLKKPLEHSFYQDVFTQLDEGELEEQISKIELFSKEQLKSEDLQHLILATKTNLATKYIAQISKNAAEKIDDRVVRSYYEANKEKYVLPNRYSFRVYSFDTEDSAHGFVEQVEKNSNLPGIEQFGGYGYDEFREIDLSSIPEAYLLHFKNSKSMDLSRVMLRNGAYEVVLYTDFKEKNYMPYARVEGMIRSKLIKSKIKELIKIELQKLQQ